MNKHLIFLITLLSPLLTPFSQAQTTFDYDDYGSVKIESATNNNTSSRQRPFNVEIDGDAIGQAKIKKGFFEGDHIRFAELDVDFGMVFYYCPRHKEGCAASIMYSLTYLDWESNPWFTQDRFHNVSFNLSAFTGRFENWFLRSQLTVACDAEDWNTDYIKYDFLFWGRYTYNECIGLHIGFIAYTGIDLNWGCPIIGADWQISPKWKLNLVYPVDISIEYTLTKYWVLALAGRNFDNRQRVKRHESLPRAVVRYRNIGAEFALKYGDDSVSANVRGGIAFAGVYRIANQHNHHGHDYDLDPSAYFGADLNFKF